MPTAYPRRAPRDALAGHLEFALKCEGVDLAILSALFKILPAAEFEALIRAMPTGAYTRRIWFLYEWLTGRTPDVPNAVKVSARKNRPTSAGRAVMEPAGVEPASASRSLSASTCVFRSSVFLVRSSAGEPPLPDQS